MGKHYITDLICSFRTLSLKITCIFKNITIRQQVFQLNASIFRVKGDLSNCMLQQTEMNCNIDVGDGCWRPKCVDDKFEMLMTDSRCL